MAKLGNLASRVLVAVVAVPIVLAIIYLERPEYTWALVFLVTLMALHEFFAMTLADSSDRTASLLAGGAAALSLYWVGPLLVDHTQSAVFASVGPVLTMFMAVIPIALYYLFRVGDITTVAVRLAYSIAGIVYVGLLFTFLALIKRDFGSLGGHMLVFVLLVAWIGDTGAYFAGRFLGKRKLYPAVSPKKTWAGAIGGVATSAAGAAGLKLGLDLELAWIHVFAMAIPGAILGQMGDLVESLVKRSTGVKDSGVILPGHGGMLDRLDAVLFLGPYVYLYMMLRIALA